MGGEMSTAARSEPLLQITLLGEAVEHAPVGVFVFDERGEYVAVNLCGCELLGLDRDEILGSRIGTFAADREAALRVYRDALAAGPADRITHVRRGDGSIVALRFRARETTIAGMTFYIGIAWPPDGSQA
jgi:PAS domain S-box-containing protein